MHNFKKVISSVVVTILLFTVVSWTIIAPYMNSEFSYFQDNKLRESIAGEIDVIAIGASHGLNAFDTGILDASLDCFSYNLSASMMTLDSKYYLLKKELDILSGGQLEYAVTVHGSDEIGKLAQGIDQMRRSILKHQELEDQMRSANSELITAMSHDLRTPLTSLLAYLEIIGRKKYTDEAQMDQLIQKSIGQTLRIKNMADQLFEYFLVYATDWESEETEIVEADQLFRQILEDYAYALESSGMKVQLQFTPVSGQIRVTIHLLQRALDNLYSNLTKYAAPEEIIRICYERRDDRLYLSVSNGSRTGQTKRESTSIGLNTCRRIIEYHGGSFVTEEETGRFSVAVTLPLLS
jgi:signal transduction histidine kinase